MTRIPSSPLAKHVAMVVLFALIVASFATPLSVYAKQYQHSFSGSATHTTKWTNYGSKTTATTFINMKQKKQVTKQKMTGSNWKTKKYAVTDNYHHVKNEDDVKYKKSEGHTHKVTGSADGLIKAVGVQLGYSYSKTSTTSITLKLAKSRPTGYYYVSVHFDMRDFKVIATTQVYTKEKNQWVKAGKASSRTVTGALPKSGPTNTGIYYEWTKSN